MQLNLDNFIYVMKYLHKNRDKNVTKTRIALDLNISYMQVCKIVKELEDEGFVVQSKEKGKKNVYVYLTKKGMYLGRASKKMVELVVGD